MSDGLNPTGSSQPAMNQVYEMDGNPVERKPEESKRSQTSENESKVDQRIPQKQASSIDEATPSSLGYGIHGAPPGEEVHGMSAEVGRSGELTAEQMGAPAEDKVANAVKAPEKTGAAGREPGLESDLDRKRAEQAPQREAQKEAEGRGFDVGGVLGQRGGPASSVG